MNPNGRCPQLGRVRARPACPRLLPLSCRGRRCILGDVAKFCEVQNLRLLPSDQVASFVPDVCQVGIAGSAKCGRLLQNDRVSVVAMTSAHLGDDARHILLAAQRHERFVSRCRGACKPSATAVTARDNNSLSFHSARLVAQGIWMTDTRVGVRNWLVSACPHDGRNATASRQTTNIAGSQSADPICATSPHRDLTRFAERHTERAT